MLPLCGIFFVVENSYLLTLNGLSKDIFKSVVCNPKEQKGFLKGPLDTQGVFSLLRCSP